MQLPLKTIHIKHVKTLLWITTYIQINKIQEEDGRSTNVKSTHLRVSITSVIWQPQNDRENPDEFQIFTRNALEFTWCNQNKNFWTSFTKSKRFQLHMSWLKCSLLTFNEEDYLKNFAFWFFFLATWVNIAALLYVREAIGRGFCLQ